MDKATPRCRSPRAGPPSTRWISVTAPPSDVLKNARVRALPGSRLMRDSVSGRVNSKILRMRCVGPVKTRCAWYCWCVSRAQQRKIYGRRGWGYYRPWRAGKGVVAPQRISHGGSYLKLIFKFMKGSCMHECTWKLQSLGSSQRFLTDSAMVFRIFTPGWIVVISAKQQPKATTKTVSILPARPVIKNVSAGGASSNLSLIGQSNAIILLWWSCSQWKGFKLPSV